MKSLSSYWRLSLAFGALLLSGRGQVGTVMHASEEIYDITIGGSTGLAFRGSYLVATNAGESKKGNIQGSVPTKFEIQGAGVSLTVQKTAYDGNLQVEISKTGVLLKRLSSEAPYGVVTLTSTPPASGLPRQTEFEVNGSVKFAFLTMTSETGDIEQHLVPIPFAKEFFPRAGWIVSLSAQKTLVTKPDPIHSGGILVQDDGVSGTIHATIRVSGKALEQAESSEPYGIASATVRIP